MTEGRVICLGQVMLDVVARLDGPIRRGTDTPAPVSVTGGGSAANTAAWLAALDVPVSLVARVGDDGAGRQLTAELRDAGVEVALAVDATHTTGVCVVLVDPSDERSMVPDQGANAALSPDDLPAGLLTADDYLHVSGYTLLTDGSRAAALAALTAARAVGAPISVDAASAGPLRDAGPEAFWGWLGTGVLLLANAEEAKALAGEREAADAARELARRCGEAVVKLGGDGAVWSDGLEMHTASAVRHEGGDSTGAGDAFAAGLLAARRSGAGPADALQNAVQVGARALGVVGGRPAIGSG